MLSRPEIGMKVRIIRTTGFSQINGGVKDVSFDSKLCDTGVLVDIQKNVPLAHAPKAYFVKLDPPNFGTYEFLGTEYLERVKDG